MRCVLIADEGFAEREASLMSRLAVGLADEGVRVVRAIPGTVDLESTSAEGSGLLGEPIAYQPDGLPFSTGARAGQLLKLILARLPANDQKINVIHAFGGRSWGVALELAQQTGATVLLEFWRSGLARRLKALNTSNHRIDIAVPDRALIDDIASPALTERVRHTPWGVYAPAELPTREGAPSSIILCASGIAKSWVTLAFQAAAELARDHPKLRLFVDARAARRTGLWPRGVALGVADRLTLVDSIESHRDLSLRSDLLMLPEALGEHRSFVLDAMARGVAVLAHRDPRVSHLHSGDQVRLVEQATVEDWRRGLQGLIESPVELASRRKVAREYVLQHHRASAHIAAVLGAYEAAAHGKSATGAKTSA